MANLRISGGDLRGRKIRVPAGVRPTGARVREALFSIWRERVRNARFLDLFAGAGSVGLEALGRGADEVVFVESRRAVAKRLAETRARWGLEDACRVVTGELPGALSSRLVTRSAPYDLAFADPPYGFEGWDPLLERLEALLAPGAAVAIEHGAADEPPSGTGSLTLVDVREYGESRLSLLAR